MNSTKIFVFGLDGKMGQTLKKDIKEPMTIIGGVDRKGLHIQKPFDNTCKTLENQQYTHYGITELKRVLERTEFDIVVDFSNAFLINTVLEVSYFFKKPLLLASTGHKKTDLTRLKKYSKTIPIMVAPNLSLGINTLLELVNTTKNSLQDSEISIVEKHHNQKLDCPSGTAKLIKKAIGTKIKINSIRGGNIAGTHEVSFYNGDEILTISHTAISRSIYTTGAIRAIEFLSKCPIGLYKMSDCLKK